MPDLFSKVSEILSDPESARKIREIATSLSSQPVEEPPNEQTSEVVALPDSDGGGGVEQVLSGLSSGLSSHSRELALLYAVRPYLRTSRAGKIDRAIRAIRVIDMLSNFR